MNRPVDMFISASTPAHITHTSHITRHVTVTVTDVISVSAAQTAHFAVNVGSHHSIVHSLDWSPHRSLLICWFLSQLITRCHWWIFLFLPQHFTSSIIKMKGSMKSFCTFYGPLLGPWKLNTSINPYPFQNIVQEQSLNYANDNSNTFICFGCSELHIE